VERPLISRSSSQFSPSSGPVLDDPILALQGSLKEPIAKTDLALYAMPSMLRERAPSSLGEISQAGRFATAQVRARLGKPRHAGLVRTRSRRGDIPANASGEISVVGVVHVVDFP